MAVYKLTSPFELVYWTIKSIFNCWIGRQKFFSQVFGRLAPEEDMVCAFVRVVTVATEWYMLRIEPIQVEVQF